MTSGWKFSILYSETEQPDEAWSFTQLSQSNSCPDTCSQALNQNCTWGQKSRPRRNQVMQPWLLFIIKKIKKTKEANKIPAMTILKPGVSAEVFLP